MTGTDRHNRKGDRRTRLIALLATVLFHGAVVAVLIAVTLTYSAPDDAERVWPPVDEDEILYGGEYVMLGQVTSSSTSDNTTSQAAEAPEASVEASDRVDQGPALAEPEHPLVSEQPSPVKVKKPETEPKPSGPTREELEAQAKAKKQEETARRINSRVKFGTGTSTGSDGKAGSPNGNADKGALSGMPGTDLKGRTLASWSKPSGSATGTIVVRVHVNRKGRITRAEYVSGSGPISANMAARRSCEAAALQSAFSVSDDAPADQVGRITYHFK